MSPKLIAVPALGLALALLGGCHHVNHASLKTKNASISVGSSGGGSAAPARHCPPGQAKKGRC